MDKKTQDVIAAVKNLEAARAAVLVAEQALEALMAGAPPTPTPLRNKGGRVPTKHGATVAIDKLIANGKAFRTVDVLALAPKGRKGVYTALNRAVVRGRIRRVAEGLYAPNGAH